MSDELVDMEFNRDSDVPPREPVAAGHYEATVAGVQFFRQGAEDKPFPGCDIARVSYRVDSEGDSKGKYVRPFPYVVRGHEDAWKWFDWCKRMGYDTTSGFRFSETDVVGIKVNLRFGPPRVGKDGKQYDNLEDVQRLG